MTSFNVDNIERFYLTTCTYRSYEKGLNSITDIVSNVSAEDNVTHSIIHIPENQGDIPLTLSEANFNKSKEEQEKKNLKICSKVPSSIEVSTEHALLNNRKKKSLKRGNQQKKGQYSLISDKEVFAQTFSRIFEEPPPEVSTSSSWTYALRDTLNSGDRDEYDLDTLLCTNTAVNIIICGSIIIGVLTICEYI